MQELIAELNRCMDEGEGRGNVTIAIAGVRAIIKRHQTPVTPPTRDYPSTLEYLQDRDLQRTQRDSRSLKIH